LLAPQELISAIMEDHWGNALQFAKVIRDNCNPNKWGDKKPDEDQAREMMKEMLDKVVSQLVPRDIYILHMRVTGKSNLPAIRALDNLLLTKYSEAILRFENTADQKRIGELRSFKG